ncbi:MAG TPA: hypothetical protein VHZ50_10345 [Puia sp.]|jgi:hypothetical protein|nr:hypothetical protein [Puia sp.]
MMKSFLLVAGIAVTFFMVNCKKNVPTALKATVIDTSNIDCGFPMLSFADDSNRIRSITKNPGLAYVVKGLPANFKIPGQKLLVQVSAIPANDDFVCTDLGITYPHLLVVQATSR